MESRTPDAALSSAAAGKRSFESRLFGWRLGVLAVSGLLLVALIAIGVSTYRSLQALRQNPASNIGWSASQFEVQLVKLQHMLVEAEVGRPNRLQLQRRWDNLLSRLGPLEAAITPEIARARPDFASDFAKVKAGIAEVARYVSVRSGSPLLAQDVIQRPLADLAPAARRLSVAATQIWDLDIEARRDRLVNRLTLMVGIAALLVMALGIDQLMLRRQRHRLRQLAAAHRDAAIAAETASNAKSAFLARMSHELKTPLNAIIGFGEVLEGQMLGPIGNARYREYSSDIVRSGRNLLGLVNDVLDMTELETGHAAAVPEAVALDALAGAALDDAGRLAQSRGIELVADIPAGLPRIMADPQHLHRAMQQILSNAIKFTPAGGRVHLSLSTVEPNPEGRRVELRLRDTGPGLAPDAIPRLLTPFSQVADSMVYRGDGLGLGLPIAKALTELNGGTFRILSETGRGTEIRLGFPAPRVE